MAFALAESAEAIVLPGNPTFNLPAATYPKGVFTSPQFTIPDGIAQVIVVIVVSAPDISDPTKSLTFELDRRDPADSNNWLFDHGFTWQGGSLDKSGQPASPSSFTGVGPLAGQVCRFRITLPDSLTASLAISTA